MLISTLLVVAISVAASSFVGGFLLLRHLEEEAENRVKQHLNSAYEFYSQRLELISSALTFTAYGERFSQAVELGDIEYLRPRLERVRAGSGLDTMYAIADDGRVILRAHNPSLAGDNVAQDVLVAMVLAGADEVTGTVLVPLDVLAREDPALAERARVQILPTPKAIFSKLTELDAGMMLGAATAVRRPDGKRVGVLLGGVLLNRNFDLVDQVQNTVFRDERHQGRLIGTATIFQGDVRISTNVKREDGSRAIGTRVASDVFQTVLDRGETWVGPAWVVNDWYVSAYEPIVDTRAKRIGILYVGVLKDKFDSIARRTFAFFAASVLACLLIAGFVAWKVADSITRPLRDLASAAEAIGRADFSRKLTVSSRDEIGLLARTFNTMARSLQERDELLKERTRLQLTRSERLASIGRLAAGVAHEINNPLTSVLTFANLMLRMTPTGTQPADDLQTIIQATTRCRDIVRKLLNFSRQAEPKKAPADLNAVIREAIHLVQNQSRLRSIQMEEELDPDLPAVFIDANQIQEVAVNLLVNAIDAMSKGGRLVVRSCQVENLEGKWIELDVIDNGCGITAENLDHIFDPFFTTKPAGEGTGLGLAIAYGIVSEHGGSIAVSSEPDRGSTFKVRLPAGAGG